MPDPPETDLLSRLPDLARWIEARSSLLSQAGRVAGFCASPLTAVIWSPENRVVAVVGKPEAADLRLALRNDDPLLEVLAQVDDGDHLARLLPGWGRQLAILHQLEPGFSLPASRHQVRLMTSHQICSSTPLPAGIKQDLGEALGKVSTTWIDGRPVSFCYVAAETESLWDISIETLPDYRRRGAAVSCTTTLIHRMRGRGKEPVWGALESNHASLALAAKIGFRPVDRLWVFERP